LIIKKEYQDAVNLLYQAFLGKENPTNTITNKKTAKRFSDIKLQDYDIDKKCGDEGVFTQIFKGNDAIFREYIKRIQKMIDDNKKYNLQLVNILKQVFIIDKTTSPFIVTINPNLTEAMLDSLINKTRQIIVSLYSVCEKDFLYVLEIYNELIESKTIKSVGYNKQQSLNVQSILSNKQANDALEKSNVFDDAVNKTQDLVKDIFSSQADTSQTAATQADTSQTAATQADTSQTAATQADTSQSAATQGDSTQADTSQDKSEKTDIYGQINPLKIDDNIQDKITDKKLDKFMEQAKIEESDNTKIEGKSANEINNPNISLTGGKKTKKKREKISKNHSKKL
jgi:hypothetical protein